MLKLDSKYLVTLFDYIRSKEVLWKNQQFQEKVQSLFSSKKEKHMPGVHVANHLSNLFVMDRTKALHLYRRYLLQQKLKLLTCVHVKKQRIRAFVTARIKSFKCITALI